MSTLPLLPSTAWPHCYWVISSLLLAGAHPGVRDAGETRRRIELLYRSNIRVFINLTQPDEWVNYEPQLQELSREYGTPLSYYSEPIVDRGLPTAEQMTRILHIVDGALEQNRGVYVHCLAGIGRTGTTVGCYLVRHGRKGQSALTALARMRRDVPHAHIPSPETEAQREFVLGWRRGK